MGRIEEEYQDVLHNIESALVSVYREDEEMTDWEALKAVKGLIRAYTAEQRNRSQPNLKLTPAAEEAYEQVKFICDWRLGRAHFEDESGAPVDLGLEPLTVSEIIACLKRIRRSIEMWNKRGGRRGYFNYVDQFLP